MLACEVLQVNKDIELCSTYHQPRLQFLAPPVEHAAEADSECHESHDEPDGQTNLAARDDAKEQGLPAGR